MNTVALTKNGMNPVLNIPDAHMGRRRIIRFLQQLPDAFQRCLVNAAAIVSDADRKGFLTRGENSNATSYTLRLLK